MVSLVLLLGFIVFHSAAPHRMATFLLLLASPAAEASPLSASTPACPSHCGQAAAAGPGTAGPLHCHPACNTFACGHLGCSFAEAAQQCLSDTERAMRVAPAAANVSVRLDVRVRVRVKPAPPQG